MPRIVNNPHVTNARHSGYHTSLLNDSHSVLQKIATNTENINVNVGDVEVNTNDLEVLQTATNSKLDVIDSVLDAILIDSDAIDSSLNTIEAQSVLTASRLNNIQNWIGTSDGAGGGDKLGVIVTNLLAKNTEIDNVLDAILVDSDAIDSSLNTIEANSTLQASRLNNIQNSITADGAGGGDKIGVINTNILAKNTEIETSCNALISANHTDLVALESSLTSMESKQDTINTSIGTGNTTLSTMNTNIVSTNSKLDTLESSANSLISANHTDLVALENSLASMEGKQDTQVTHLSEIEGAIETLEACVASNKVNVNISSGGTDVSALSTHVKQDTIIGHLDGVEGKLDILETTLTEIATDGNNIQTLLSTLDGVQDNVLSKLGEIEVSADALISANHTDLVALENSLASMESKQDTQVTHLSEIEGAIETLEACVASNKVNVNIASGSATDVSALSTHAKQDTIIGHLDGVEGKLDTLETTLTEIATDGNNIQTLLSTLDGVQDNALTKLGEIETTNNANQVLITATNGKLDDIETAVQILDNIVIAEDSAHSSGDAGIMALGVHQTTGTLLGANNDYTPLSVNVNQHLRSATELQTFAFTLPSSGSIGNGNTAETDVFQFHHKVESATFFVGANNSAPGQFSFLLKGSLDGSAYFNISSSLYSQFSFNDNDKQNYFTIKGFNIKHVKLLISNSSGSTDTFKVFVCA